MGEYVSSQKIRGHDLIPTSRHAVRWFAATATIAVYVVVAGCSSGPATSPQPPFPSSSAPTATGTPLAAYRGFWQVQEAASHSPAARDWTSDLSLYTVDPLRTQVIDDWRRWRDLGIVTTGSSAFAPRITSQSAGSAQIADCTDTSDVNATQNGKTLGKPALSRYQLDATVLLIDGAWRLSEITYHRQQAC